MLFAVQEKRSTDSEKHWCNGAKKMFKHRPFVNFVKYFLPLWRRPRRLFFKATFLFFFHEKKKRLPRYEGRKKGGEGKRKGVYTRRVDVYSRVVDTKKNVASEKKKENIYYRACVCVLTLCVCIYTHTSFLCAYFVTRVPCGCFQANDVVMADLGAWNGGDKNRRGFLYFLNLNHNCFEVKQRFSLLEFLVEFII